jgi:hypothetical protein
MAQQVRARVAMRALAMPKLLTAAATVIMTPSHGATLSAMFWKKPSCHRW